MPTDAVKDVRKIWDAFSLEKSWDNFVIDYSIHKKMFLAFQPGPSYYWLLNAKTATFEMMSPEAEKVLGYPLEEITFPFFMGKIHPDDMPFLLNFETSLADFFSRLPSGKRFGYKIQYDFRLKKADDTYIRILNQMAMVQYEADSSLIRTFGVQADITHLKPNGKPMLSFIAFEDHNPSYYDVDVKAVFKPAKSIFSLREKEVLQLMLSGMMSKEICTQLNISKHTVDSHRKHLLEKAQSKSIPEMINKAIVNGWI